MELINSVSLLVLLLALVTITQESYGAPLDRDRSLHGTGNPTIDAMIREFLNRSDRSADGTTFERASRQSERHSDIETGTGSRYHHGYYNARNIAESNSPPVYFPAGDFALNDDDFERILSNLFEESRQATLDKMSNQNDNIEKYLVDTDLIDESDLRAEVVKNLTPECAICLEAHEPDQKRASLRCGHTFHRTCVKTWLQTSLTCPICRDNAR